MAMQPQLKVSSGATTGSSGTRLVTIDDGRMQHAVVFMVRDGHFRR